MVKIIICKNCNTKKEHEAKGLCSKCYELQRLHKKNPNMKYLCEKKWKRNNIKKVREWDKGYREKNKEKICEYRKKKKKEINAYKRLKRKQNPKIRISDAISCQMRLALKGNKKGYHWEELVGYTLENLKKHLENQFKKRMNWENFGSCWHIDHRIPVSWFNFKSFEDKGFKECWSLDNLQPKIIKDNESKGNRYAEPTLNQFLEVI